MTTEQTFRKQTAVSPELLNILICPLTKEKLTYDRKNNRLLSPAAHLAYPIHNGIPIMIIDKAVSY